MAGQADSAEQTDTTGQTRQADRQTDGKTTVRCTETMFSVKVYKNDSIMDETNILSVEGRAFHLNLNHY
jgi:hypothetical protein